jgi:hypothetical protein
MFEYGPSNLRCKQVPGLAEMLEAVSDDARHGAAGRDHRSPELPPVPPSIDLL